MKITKTSIKRPVTVIMMALIVIILGGVSLAKLSMDLYPDFDIPVVIVSTSYSGAGPAEIESLITKPVESSMATVSGIKDISSTSTEGSSLVIVEFEFGTDIESASMDMREKLDMVAPFLPEDANNPIVFKIDPNAFPIMSLSINSEKGLADAQNIVENKIQNRIERIEGVAQVDVTGGFSEEVVITTDPAKLKAYDLSQTDVVNVLRAENMNLPGGSVNKGSKELVVRSLGEFSSVEEIANLPIMLKSGSIIHLSDVADVRLQDKDLNSYNRLSGNASIGMTVTKESNANTVQVADAILEEIEKLESELDGIEILVVYNEASFISSTINSVTKSGLLGAFLAVFILFIFLRNLETTLIVGIAIPLSVIATFTLMYFSGVTLNLMTMGGLALGLGMLVDNSIVVLENIYRYNSEGHSSIESADLGTSEVGMAVVAATLTTVSVFIPVVFIEGITSMLFKELAMTVVFSLMASLAVSLTIVPMLASKLIKPDRKEKEHGRFFKAFDRGFEKLQNGYKKLLGMAIRHKGRTVAVSIMVFVLSISSLGTLGAEFIPEVDEGRISISVSLPLGYNLDETDKVIREIVESVEEIEEVDYIFESVGGGDMFTGTGGSSNAGRIDVVLVPLSERNRSTNEVADEIRTLSKEIPGAKISIAASQSQSMSSGTPIAITLKGDDLDILEELADEVVAIVESVEGTREATSNLSDGKEELIVKINRDVASQYGLTAYQVAQSVRDSVQGIVATQYKVKGSELDIRVKSEDYVSENVTNFSNMLVATPIGVDVPLNYVADIYSSKGPTAINRTNQTRSVSVTSGIYQRDLNSVARDIQKELDDMYFPDGYSYDMGGENEELIDAFTSLILALGLAIILVYMVMASQFESLLNPFIIMMSVPLAVSGGALGLFLTGKPVSVPALIGVIMLAGIVVNNGIVLIDYIQTLIQRGHDPEEAVVMAGMTRLRPILMTTATTVLGLLPLALGLGEGTEAISPMAITVIFGLLLSTLLTLVFVPIVFLLLNKRKFKKAKMVEERL